jgi:hypothetical protein
MPGFPNDQGYEELGASINGWHEAGITRRATISKPAQTSNMERGDINVKFIPSQMDPLAGASTMAARQNPIQLMMQDAVVLITMLPYLPYIFLPLRANDESSELYMSLQGARDMLLQCWLFIMETNLLLMAAPALLLLPGAISMTAIALCCLTIYLVAYPMQGPRVTHSNMDSQTKAMAAQHRDERWLFVNGCATG